MLDHLLPIGQIAIGSPTLLFDKDNKYYKLFTEFRDESVIESGIFTKIADDFYITPIEPGIYAVMDDNRVQLIESTDGFLVLCKWGITSAGEAIYKCCAGKKPCDKCKATKSSFISSYCLKIDNMKDPDIHYMNRGQIEKMGTKFGYNQRGNIEIVANIYNRIRREYSLNNFEIICGNELKNPLDIHKQITKTHYNTPAIKEFLSQKMPKEEFNRMEVIMIRIDDTKTYTPIDISKIENVIVAVNRRMGRPPPPPLRQQSASTSASISRNASVTSSDIEPCSPTISRGESILRNLFSMQPPPPPPMQMHMPMPMPMPMHMPMYQMGYPNLMVREQQQKRLNYVRMMIDSLELEKKALEESLKS